MHHVWRALAAAAVLACTLNTAAAQGEGPTVDIAVGFDGYCRQDYWCPVQVSLSNEGAAVEGELRLTVPSYASGIQDDIYSHGVILPAHARKTYFLYVPLRGWTSELEVQLVASGRTLISQMAPVRRLEEEDQLYVVVSSDPSALNLLGEVAPPGADAAVAHLSLDDLPPEPLAWEALDVLVLNDVDTTTLGSDQLRALEIWLEHGGHLVVGGGTGAIQTAAGVSHVLPVVVGQIRTVAALEALGSRLDAPLVDGPYPVAEAVLSVGQPLIRQGELILLARRGLGSGTVDFLAFDAGLDVFAQWEHSVQMWRYIVTAESAGRARLTIREGWDARQAVSSIPGLEPAPAIYVLGFVLAYTLLVGPVNYVVLRKLDRRELAWVIIPVLIIAFSTCAYVTGYLIRGSDVIVHRLALVHVPEGASTGRVSGLVGIFSPRRTHYDVQVQNAAVRRLPEDGYGGPDTASLYVDRDGETWTADELRVDVGGIEAILSEGFADVTPPQADLQISLEPGNKWLQVTGSIRNGPLALQNAVLLVGQSEHPLGDLAPGQTVSDQWRPGLPAILSPTYYDDTYYGRTWGWDDPDDRRHLMLEAILAGSQSYLAPGVFLVGWSNETPVDVALAGRSFTTSDATLYVFALPAQTSPSEGAASIPPAFITWGLEETSGRVEVREGYVSIFGGASGVLRYSVWPEVMVSRVDQLALHLTPELQASGTPPDVSLWDWGGERWESVAVAWGSSQVSDPGRYVHPDGTVLVRLSSDTYCQFAGLQISIEGRHQ